MMVIVIGRGHSGTRLIAKVLFASGVYMGQQFNASCDLIPARHLYDACRLLGRHVVYRGGLQWDFSALLGPPLEQPPTALSLPTGPAGLLAALARRCPAWPRRTPPRPAHPVDPRFQCMVRLYLHSVLQSREERVGWKLPETTLIYPWIVRMFPDAYFIHWVRDPRDCIMGPHLTDDLANFGVPCDPTDDLEFRRAVSWFYQREIVRATPPPRHSLVVKFEDFVLHQDRERARLEDFLGCKLAAIPVRPHPLSRWKQDPVPHYYDFFAPDLAEIGYEPDPGSPRPYPPPRRFRSRTWQRSLPRAA